MASYEQAVPAGGTADITDSADWAAAVEAVAEVAAVDGAHSPQAATATAAARRALGPAVTVRGQDAHRVDKHSAKGIYGLC